MPELPDITVYVDALQERIVGQPVLAVVLNAPFLLRTFDPPLHSIDGKVIRSIRRLGKRLVWALDDDLFVVIHLMIAGRFKWSPASTKVARNRNLLAIFEFPTGLLSLTEAGSTRRASLHVVRGAGSLAQFERGGVEPLQSSTAQFAERLRSENHTVKRALTDPRLFSGIGNAYSDEILHRAGMSPVTLTSRLTDEEIARLHEATRAVLTEWIARLRTEAGDGFPQKVTAFRPEMAVHGKYGQPCPVCGTSVRRIRYADNETNYCPRCQTKGRLLADRSLSRLLREDWPKTIEQLEG